MKALTVWQPYASLIIVGAKPYEFRSRSYSSYPGHPKSGDRIAIHAAMRPVRHDEVIDLRANLASTHFGSGLIADRARPLLDAILDAFELTLRGKEMRAKLEALAPLGAALGTAVIGKPVRADTVRSGVSSIDWAWPLTDIEKFDEPVPARGMQGFWEWRTE